MSSKAQPPAWVAVVHAASRLFGVAAAGMILVSIAVVCQMVFVRAALNESSIWQTEFVMYLWASIPWWHDAWVNDQTTSSIWRARLWIPYLSVPLGLSLLCLQYLAEIWLVITQREHPFGLSPDDRL